MQHNCQYVVTFHTRGDQLDAELCDRPTSLNWHGLWVCADHYDRLETTKENTAKLARANHQMTPKNNC